MTLGRPAEDAVELLAERADRVARDPIRYLRWLPIQWEFLADPARVKQIRAGEQTIGKTTAALSEVVGACRGVHPLAHRTADHPPLRPVPQVWWVVCQSWEATIEIMRKLRALLPRDEIEWDATNYTEEAGFGPKKSPVVVFKNRSLIRFKTANQDAINFASATIDGVLFDEPPPRGLLEEAIKRTERKGGRVLLSYTPIHAPVEYLRELTLIPVEEGGISDHHRRLTPRELIPVGYHRPLRTLDGRPMDATWISHLEHTTASELIDVVVHGGWETRAVDRYFTNFRDGGDRSHVHSREPDCEVDLRVGIDHGSRPGKQIAVVVATWWESRPNPEGMAERIQCARVIDEYVDHAGTATPAMDARGILNMLARNGWGWNPTDLRFAGGDRVHMQGTGAQKSNKDLQAQIAKVMGISPSDLRPQIRNIKMGQGRGHWSVKARARWLFHLMSQDAFSVHPRCTRVRAALARTTLDDDDWKDPFDAVVYALDQLIFPRVRVTGSVSIR